ncbi:hypothetical protein HW555_002853 [Spodoptera exigua]|uniref:Uncharacterized protein n=1 Tax=Spodoptera exigua TaxID=7107 RepID=A0A835GQI6_SPOEX|nr:hypothetical protein HW555_002853 [Spodoptera exigua]
MTGLQEQTAMKQKTHGSQALSSLGHCGPSGQDRLLQSLLRRNRYINKRKENFMIVLV